MDMRFMGSAVGIAQHNAAAALQDSLFRNFLLNSACLLTAPCTAAWYACCRAAKKVIEEVAREQTIAARISGIAPSMHVFLSPNTDGDESTIVTADVIAGRSYVHKVDAVLVPKSMLKYLEDFTAKKTGKKAGKKGNSTLTVTEALKGLNGTAVEGKNATNRKSATDDLKSKEAYIKNATAPANETTKPTAKAAKSAGTSADMVFATLVGLPLVLASFLAL
jgi:hypothetical protein